MKRKLGIVIIVKRSMKISGSKSRSVNLSLALECSPGVWSLIYRGGGGGDRGAGARENRGREGYGRREKKGREAGSLRWREAGEKFQKSSFFFCYCLPPVKETNPTTFLDFHLTFSEA